MEPKGSAGAGLSVLRQHYKLMLVAMKKVFTLVLAVTFLIPSVSFAAGLTSQQAASLIGVVQSSPGTPASAFVSLITAFSNITVNQATSLITVVQAAPGVPANAFVDLLTSFTIDIPTTPASTQAVTPPITQSTAPTIVPTATTQSTTPSIQTTTDPSQTPTEISIQGQVCNLSQTNLKTEYLLDNLLANGNIDGRIFMNAYILSANQGKNYYESNPVAVMTITTSDKSNDKVLNGSGNTGPCGFHYPYQFYVTERGTYSITYSVLGLSKTITLNIK